MKWSLALVFLCGVARAYTNGNDLRDQCGAALEKQTGARAGLCVGYINAYRELAAMLPESAGIKLCLPAPGVGNEQFIKIVLKYLDQHPEKLHLPAAQLIYDATDEAFPCHANASTDKPASPQK